MHHKIDTEIYLYKTIMKKRLAKDNANAIKCQSYDGPDVANSQLKNQEELDRAWDRDSY